MEVPPIIVQTTESKEQRTWTLKLHYCDIFHFYSSSFSTAFVTRTAAMSSLLWKNAAQHLDLHEK